MLTDGAELHEPANQIFTTQKSTRNLKQLLVQHWIKTIKQKNITMTSLINKLIYTPTDNCLHSSSSFKGLETDRIIKITAFKMLSYKSLFLTMHSLWQLAVWPRIHKTQSRSYNANNNATISYIGQDHSEHLWRHLLSHLGDNHQPAWTTFQSYDKQHDCSRVRMCNTCICRSTDIFRKLMSMETGEWK